MKTPGKYEWIHNEDVHLASGMSCSDCHRNGVDHMITRGDIEPNHNPHSSIFDITQTQVIKGKFSRVLSWYDNEWGFSNRMCDTAIQISGLI